MSREIKFRVWSEEDREYRTDCRLTELFTSETGTPATVYSDEGDRFDIEQYTGLKDKNGKEIWEGDIVRYRSDILLGHAICVVTFYNCRWALFQYDAPVWAISEGDSENIEVIGNIHEPPKGFRPEHLKRMGVSINKGGEE